MSNRSARESDVKRDQSGSREASAEMYEQVEDGRRIEPHRIHPNRDQSRGDWDRSGRGDTPPPEKQE